MTPTQYAEASPVARASHNNAVLALHSREASDALVKMLGTLPDAQRITNVEEFTLHIPKFDRDLHVSVDTINDVRGFKWRLRTPTHTGEFSTHYQGVTTLEDPDAGVIYGYATHYWDGYLPVETPFLVMPFVKKPT